MTDKEIVTYLKELKVFKVIHKLYQVGGSVCGLGSVYNGIRSWKYVTCKNCLTRKKVPSNR